MNRKNFISLVAGSSVVSFPQLSFAGSAVSDRNRNSKRNAKNKETLQADIVIVGGGVGGCAAALSALRNGLTVIMTEETDWIGGQLTQQGVPPDEHQWIETTGATQLYRDFRTAIRKYYKEHYPLTDEAKALTNLNPGNGNVSRIGHEPRVALAVLKQMFAPYIASGKLNILLESKVISAEMKEIRVEAVNAVNLCSGKEYTLIAPYFVDATEIGELLPLTGTAYVTGTESKKETRELHAPEIGDSGNNQSFTVCFAVDYRQGENHTIDKPEKYEFWRTFQPQMIPAWPAKQLSLMYSSPYKPEEPKELGFNPTEESTSPLLNLWTYRRIIHKKNFKPGTIQNDITIINWPQNDYYNGNLIDVTEEEFKKQVDEAKQLNLSLLYWLQTEAPRPDGGKGWPGIRLRKDVLGTEDGMAKYPYIRESRRIKALFTVLEEHVGKENRLMVAGQTEGQKAAEFKDSVGIGYYPIDLHPSCKGLNQLNLQVLQFQIPLGALIPQETENLLPACKNIGTTHITNGCYRLHPVEWNIGESVGALIAFAKSKNVSPRGVYANPSMLEDFQQLIHSQGIETHWPE
jgi:hypothetical protein